MINKNDYGSYEAPEAIVFSVRTEDCFMDVSNGANYGDDGRPGGDDDYSDGDGF